MIHFPISINGVDYYNPNNKGIEFKESFNLKKQNPCFKIPKKQLKETDFFVFSFHYSEYYVLRKSFFQDKYSFENKAKACHPRLNTIIRNSIFETSDIEELKEYLDKLK